MIGVQYRTKMRNEKVYEVTKTRPLTTDITKQDGNYVVKC